MDLVRDSEWLYRQDLAKFITVNCRFKDNTYVTKHKCSRKWTQQMAALLNHGYGLGCLESNFVVMTEQSAVHPPDKFRPPKSGQRIQVWVFSIRVSELIHVGRADFSKCLLVAWCWIILSCTCFAQTPKTNNASESVKMGLAHKYTNLLSGEKSPYLLQHQHNPVNWRPWGKSAFEIAKQQNKPILLSIGYSTCHWCHVMERESFENEAIAEILNKHFISIKVDREERPDVDKIYMSYLQATTGSGGWPLNVFLTPDLKPFYGGTYFPPVSKGGRPGFDKLLDEIQKAWTAKQKELLEIANDTAQKMFEMSALPPSNKDEPLIPSLLTNAISKIKSTFDPVNGGFTRAPKFPRPSLALLLMRGAALQRNSEVTKMVLTTCDKMANGGIRDHLGGGFARYSVDEQWLVPHFEKMLYDNAQLAQLYLDAYVASGDSRYSDVASEIFDYIQRDMTHPEGGFYSAEDADSEGKEGKFYCWTVQQLRETLTEPEFEYAVRRYGVTEKGNFLDHSDPNPPMGLNVLYSPEPALSLKNSELEKEVRKKLLKTRSSRIRPHLDDKILTSWNGLMLSAFAKGSVVLRNPSYLRVATNNLAFIKAKLWDTSTKTLFHRWRDGERHQIQLLDAYANLLCGTLDLYEATLESGFLTFSIELAESMVHRFHDNKAGGFWQSQGLNEDLIVRFKEDYDGAEPSGNSSAINGLLRLAIICDRKDWRKIAEEALTLFYDRLQQHPTTLPHMLSAATYLMYEPKRVVIAGSPQSDEARSLIHAVQTTFQPVRVILGTVGAVEAFAKTLEPSSKNKATAYVCTGSACLPPTSDPAKLRELLTPKQ